VPGFLNRLTSFGRLIIFDRRGVGASDRLPTGIVPTWEEWAEDLKVVLDAVGSKTAALLSVADGGAMFVSFAAAHPDSQAPRHGDDPWSTHTTCG
jgi:pimeloyl-ACP methyl ester carboxylesterase